jgi:hypothetical protein
MEGGLWSRSFTRPPFRLGLNSLPWERSHAVQLVCEPVENLDSKGVGYLDLPAGRKDHIVFGAPAYSKFHGGDVARIDGDGVHDLPPFLFAASLRDAQ